MNRMIVVSVAFASLLLILPIPTHAAPEITQDLAFIDNRPAADIFGFSGLNLNLTVKATDAGGSGALTGSGSGSTAVYTGNGTFPFTQPVTVNLNAVFPIIGGAEFTRILQFPNGANDFLNVTGTYTFTVTNTTPQSTISTSHVLDRLEVIPIPINLAFSDQSTTPVFTFTDPDPDPNLENLLRRYQVNIFDTTKTNIFVSDNLLAPSFTVPSGILEEGRTYYFRANSMDFDELEEGGLHSRLENRAMDYASLQTAVPEPSIMLLLSCGLLGLLGLRKKFKK